MRLHSETSRFHFEPLERRRLLSFSAPVTYAMGDGPLTVVSGDFNRDSRIDLGSFPGLLMGNGDGTFHTGGAWTGGAYAAATDINGDNKIDIVSLGYPNGVTVTLGNGNGTFQPPRFFPTIGVPSSAAVGDINGDGELDVVITSTLGDEQGVYTQAEVLLGDGGGSVWLAGTIPLFDGFGSSSCVLADFNGDGKLDFAAPGGCVMLGNGNGSFQTPIPMGLGWAVASGDFNGDHKQDLVAVGGNDAWLLLGRGDGTFVSSPPLEVGDNSQSVTVADFSRDGRLDFATANPGHWDAAAGKMVNGSVGLRLGNGDGTFQPLLAYAAGPSPASLTAADFNGDSFPDLAVCNIDVEVHPNSFTILLNRASWTSRNWIGPASGGNWSTANNWSPSGVPAADDLVTISGKSVNLSANATVASLALTDGASLAVASNGNRVVRTSTLFISPNSKLDLNDNDLILDYAGASQLAAIQALINSARNGGAWDGNGISSTSAAANASHNTTLGAMEATDYRSIYGPNAGFDGQSLDNTAVVVKYTYYGDTDFNGRVNFDDYVRTDSGFNSHRSGWLNGDFDGNSAVNFDDYVLIDLAFNTQGEVL